MTTDRTPQLHRTRRTLAVAVVVVAAVLAAGCGSDEDVDAAKSARPSTPTTSTTTTTTTSTTTTTTTTVPPTTTSTTTTTTAPPPPPAPTLSLQGVGPVRIGGDAAGAISQGQLEFERDDVCTAEIDGTTEDDSYVMPAPFGMGLTVTIIGPQVFSYRADGTWSTDFGVANGEDVYRVADRFRAQGWDVYVSGEDDIFGPGRLEASRGDHLFTVESDESLRTSVLWVPRPIYCD